MVENEATRRKLTEKQEKYCQARKELGSVAVEAAKEAGFCRTGLLSAVGRLEADPRIVQRISDLKEQEGIRSGVTEAKCLSDLEDERIAAMKKGDINAAIAATKLEMLYLGLLSERVTFESVEKINKLSEKEAEEARKIAQWRLRDAG